MIRRSKKYFIVLALLLLVIISIGYAMLNTTLNIIGKSSISKNIWDVHFENVQITAGSVEATKIPTIENNTTVDFETKLKIPGDFYEFTIDVVNNGTIDAMIESIIKEPELTTEQQKYLNYVIEYQNGEQIISKQLIKSNEFVRLKVRVELKKDVSSTDLPKAVDILNLGFTINSVQSDETGSSVENNGIKIVNVVKGNGTNTSDEVCIGEECFYVMYSDEDTVTMLSKYNLYVGGEHNISWTAYGKEATGKQDSNMLGYALSGKPFNGTIKFSDTNYWSNTVSSYPFSVLNSNSVLYNYLENYEKYLSTLGVIPNETRLITYEDLQSLGCRKSSLTCKSAPNWVYSTSYWTESAANLEYIWGVSAAGAFSINDYYSTDSLGCRPVITISRSLI